MNLNKNLNEWRNQRNVRSKIGIRYIDFILCSVRPLKSAGSIGIGQTKVCYLYLNKNDNYQMALIFFLLNMFKQKIKSV